MKDVGLCSCAASALLSARFPFSPAKALALSFDTDTYLLTYPPRGLNLEARHSIYRRHHVHLAALGSTEISFVTSSQEQHFHPPPL